MGCKSNGQVNEGQKIKAKNGRRDERRIGAQDKMKNKDRSKTQGGKMTW